MNVLADEKAAAWAFLCDNWSSTVQGVPFSYWFSQMDTGDLLLAVDKAKASLAPLRLERGEGNRKRYVSRWVE